MSDDTNKLDAENDANAEEKPKAVKKSTTAKKKAKEKDDSDSKNKGDKNKIVEKLQAMGVMSGGTPKVEKHIHKKGELIKIISASAAAVLIVSSFVWALNKETSERKSASNLNVEQVSVTNAMQPDYSQPGLSSANNPYNNYPGRNYASQRNTNTNYEKQRQKWIEENQRLQKRYRLQQEKWMKQQEQAQQQQYAQHMKWMQQQRALQQTREKQRPAQQPYYSYLPNNGYQGQAPAQPYNYAPGYQQPNPYYRR